MEGAVADDFRETVVEVDAGSEREVQPAGQQLGSHQPSERARHRQPLLCIGIEALADPPQRRQGRETLAKTLHAAAFVVDRDQQRRAAHRSNLSHQRAQLCAIDVVAREQDHAAHERMRQHLAIFGAELGAGDIDHQRAQRHEAFRCRSDQRL